MDWMPMNQLHPPVGVPLIVTVERTIAEGPRYMVLSPVYYMMHPQNGDWGFFEYADFGRQIGPEYFKVIAWTRYPKAYVPKTEEFRDEDYTVTEVCPHCESEIEMSWSVKARGYKAFCPVCGQRLMLCDECQHREQTGDAIPPCSYDSETDSCELNREEKPCLRN